MDYSIRIRNITPADTAKPSAPVVSGPMARAPPEQTTNVDPEGDSISYSISSTAKVVLAPGDVRSQVICEVAHVTLQGCPPLRGTANLSETLRGRCPHPSPSPHLPPRPQAHSSPCCFPTAHGREPDERHLPGEQVLPLASKADLVGERK
ncbi:hypothetical protein HPG69_008524, partial [Diceros bicornis minor]